MKLVAAVLACTSCLTESTSVNDGVEASAMMQAAKLRLPVAPDGETEAQSFDMFDGEAKDAAVSLNSKGGDATVDVEITEDAFVDAAAAAHDRMRQQELRDRGAGAAGEDRDRAYAEEDEDGVNVGAGHDAAATNDTGAADPSADNGAVVHFDHPAWLQTCQEIYLDAGANIGVQVRKFFEPEKYPSATMLPVFDAVFGQPSIRNSSNRKCALGIEPNSVHQARLRELEAVYATKGWNVHFYNFAVWKSEGVMQFNETDEPGNSDWGAALAPVLLSTRRWHVNEVRTADMDAFIRQLPHESVKLMKMDVEGAEYETLARMLEMGSLCRDTVGKITIEAHAVGNVGTWHGPRTFEEIQTRVAGLDQMEVCKDRGGPTEISNIDDESYLLDGQPWPE